MISMKPAPERRLVAVRRQAKKVPQGPPVVVCVYLFCYYSS